MTLINLLDVQAPNFEQQLVTRLIRSQSQKMEFVWL